MMLLNNWITGVFIPIGAVFIGSLVAFVGNHFQSRRAVVTERGKILLSASYELRRGIDGVRDDGAYPFVRFYAGEAFLRSSAFTVGEHGHLIDLTLRLLDQLDRFQIGLNAIPTMWGPVMGHIASPTMLNVVRHATESLFGNDHLVDKMSKEAEKAVKSLINEHMEIVEPLAKELLTEVDKALCNRRHICA